MAILAILSVLLPSTAWAGQNSIGVGVQAAPVAISTPVTPGSTHKLSVQVYNTGSDSESISLTISNLSDLKTYTLQPSWVSFDQNTVNLDSGQTATVGITLSVPSGLPDGYYTSDVWARSVDPSNSQVSLGAGSSTLIEFKVGAGTVNFSQFLHHNHQHLTKKQLRKIRRENRKLSHANAPADNSGNGFPAGSGFIAVILLGVFVFFAIRHTHRHNRRHLPKISKSAHQRVKDHKAKDDAARAKKEKNRKMREGK